MTRILVLLAAVVLAGAVVLARYWTAAPPEASVTLEPVATSTPAAPVAAETQAAATFDSGKAWEHLRQMVAIGPRPAGSPALRQTRAYITRQISAIGLTVQEQPFTAQTPAGAIQMVNLVVRLPGRRADRILITGHYDTKRSSDFTFVGASDGASSAAMLIELARVLKDRPREFTYEFVWFDGEEAVCWNWDECKAPGGGPDNTYGSRYYVDAAKKANALASIKAMILLDMIGAKDLQLERETGYSAKWLNDIVWAQARKLGHSGTFLDVETTIGDDHMPFAQAGVPTIDLIDLNHFNAVGAWHTAKDTLDAVSARSLQIVGDVVLASLPDVERHLTAR
jgi:glutaminyl-peptide cyclotransferase